MTLKRMVLLGALMLIALGILHALHVGRSDDVEPYIWIASLFMTMQGTLTILLIRDAER